MPPGVGCGQRGSSRLLARQGWVFLEIDVMEQRPEPHCHLRHAIPVLQATPRAGTGVNVADTTAGYHTFVRVDGNPSITTILFSTGNPLPAGRPQI